MNVVAEAMKFQHEEKTTHKTIARLSGITKSYPGVRALRGVSFDICVGEIHCLVGENGAGKSTLMRILTGDTQPDDGVLTIDGEAMTLSPALAIACGIGMVHQELDLIPALSVAENIFLGHEPTNQFGVVNKTELERQAVELMTNVGLLVSPVRLVRELAPAQQQLVQIAKAMSHKNRILILDEPTASLTNNEVERLFVLLRRLRADGLGIVYISHRLEEVTALADRVTVFRDGQHVQTTQSSDTDEAGIITAMVGRPLTEQYPRSARTIGAEALSVTGLSRRGEFSNVSFSVRHGEVLALAGIIGAGRSELLETIFGLRQPDSGEIRIEGKPVRITSPRSAIRLGFGLVPEERRESGLVLDRSVADNMIYAILDRLGSFFTFQSRKSGEVVDRFIGSLSIKTPSPRARAGDLSGGNQQKIVIAKWLAAGIKILLLDEPTRGVDVNAKAEIYRLIDELAKAGVAVIVASSELPEVLGISDRVLVLAQGRCGATLETASTSQVEIMRYAVMSPSDERGNSSKEMQ